MLRASVVSVAHPAILAARGACGRPATLAPAVAVALAIAGLAPRAYADDPEALESRTTAALAVGVAIELVPFAVGGTIVASSGDDAARRTGVFVSTSGFTLAPFIAHGMMDEWGRGAAFASVPLACDVGLAVLMQQSSGDVITAEGTKATRLTYWMLVSTAFAASAVGIVDAALAPSRERRHAWYLVPSRVPSGVALNLGGSF